MNRVGGGTMSKRCRNIFKTKEGGLDFSPNEHGRILRLIRESLKLNSKKQDKQIKGFNLIFSPNFLVDSVDSY